MVPAGCFSTPMEANGTGSPFWSEMTPFMAERWAFTWLGFRQNRMNKKKESKKQCRKWR